MYAYVSDQRELLEHQVDSVMRCSLATVGCIVLINIWLNRQVAVVARGVHLFWSLWAWRWMFRICFITKSSIKHRAAVLNIWGLVVFVKGPLVIFCKNLCAEEIFKNWFGSPCSLFDDDCTSCFVSPNHGDFPVTGGEISNRCSLDQRKDHGK